MSTSETHAAEFPRRQGSRLEVLDKGGGGGRDGFGDFDVRFRDRRVGSIEGVRFGAPTLRSAGGVWSLKREGARGWNYIVVNDADPLGFYRGNRWLPGGVLTIGGTEMRLRWLGWGRFVIRDPDNRLVGIRRRAGTGGVRLQLDVVGRAPAGAIFDVVVLTVSAVLLLERYVTVDGSLAGP